MFYQQFNAEVNPGDASAHTKFRREPEPSRAEYLARDSFGSVNDNRYINDLIKKPAHH